VERKLLRGCISRRLPTKVVVTRGSIPFLTREFKEFLDPETMFSRAIYNVNGLRMVLSGNDADWRARGPLIVKLATIEQLCHELEFEPDPDFWVPATIEAPNNN
jgi:hypothetical protein